MGAVGRALLYLCLCVCLYGIGVSLFGGRVRNQYWVDLGRRAVYTLAGLSVIAFVLLEIAFLRDDFSFKVVADSSSTTIPWFYKMAAPWSSQQGSLLLWVMLSSLWSSLALFLTRRRLRELSPYATAVLLAMNGFFAALACFAANPFDTTSAAATPANGAGLDPLLMHPSMMIHPPLLYCGYTLMAIPFAFAVAALVTGRLGAEWVRDTRRFALGAWLALGVGIVLGARWSYTELGWGGYWGWDGRRGRGADAVADRDRLHPLGPDPGEARDDEGLERLTGAAVRHALGVRHVPGALRGAGLDPRLRRLDAGHPVRGAAGADVLHLGRAGRLAPRPAANRAPPRLAALARGDVPAAEPGAGRDDVRDLLDHAVPADLAGAHRDLGLGRPAAFTPFVVPLALILVLLTGVGPLISWRRASIANLRRQFVFPVAFGVLVTILVGVLTDAARKPLALVMFGLGAFVIGTVAQEFARGIGARRRATGDNWLLAAGGLVRRNRRRYGGYVAHLGFAIMLIGVAASSSFQHSLNITLKPGHSASNDGYVFHYVRPTATASSERVSFGAVIDVTKGGHQVTRLHTMQSFYPSTNNSDGFIGRFFDSANADSTIGLDAGPLRDIWTVAAANLGVLQSLINHGDRVFTDDYNAIIAKNPRITPAQLSSALNAQDFWGQRDAAVEGIVGQYLKHPYPVQFLLIVSPMVTWLWAGALIIFIGGLTVLLPARLFAGRRIRVPAAARARLITPERLDLEAEREAKLREIRDAELDHATGKLSDADYTAMDSTMRAEAVAILRRLDELDALEASVDESAGEPGPDGSEPDQPDPDQTGYHRLPV